MNLRNQKHTQKTQSPISTDYQQADTYNPNNQMYYEQAFNLPQAPQPSLYDPLSHNNFANQNQYLQPNINMNPKPLQQQQQQQQPINFSNPQNIFNDPMAAMAVKYSTALADQGKAYVTENVDRWFSISKLKYYFAVDTSYVGKKLFLLSFPFFNRDWSVKYDQNVAVPPKLDKNAPDMYIPVMAFVTYILIVGISLGTKGKFTPELLGINASSALGWLLIEVVLILISLQILNVKSILKTYDIMAFCGYKYYGMILCLIAALLISPFAYTIVLIYTSIALVYFMIRNLKLLILTDANPSDYQANPHGNKRRIYLLLFVSVLQPIFMWWLTRHLA